MIEALEPCREHFAAGISLDLSRSRLLRQVRFAGDGLASMGVEGNSMTGGQKFILVPTIPTPIDHVTTN